MCSGYCTNGENFCKSCECEEKCGSQYPFMCDCRKGNIDLICITHVLLSLEDIYRLEKKNYLKNCSVARDNFYIFISSLVKCILEFLGKNDFLNFYVIIQRKSIRQVLINLILLFLTFADLFANFYH